MLLSIELNISEFSRCFELNIGVFAFPFIILKLIEYNIPITSIPDKRFVIFSFTWRSPETIPAIAPPIIETKTASIAGAPDATIDAVIAAPRV